METLNFKNGMQDGYYYLKYNKDVGLIDSFAISIFIIKNLLFSRDVFIRHFGK